MGEGLYLPFSILTHAPSSPNHACLNHSSVVMQRDNGSGSSLRLPHARAFDQPLIVRVQGSLQVLIDHIQF